MGRKHNEKIVPIRRLHTDALYISREEIAKKTNKERDTITGQLADLEEAGLILRDHENKNGSYNKLKIYLLKDTPFFTQANGIELEKITHLNNHTNHSYLKEKYDIDRTEKLPHLKLVKSTDLEGGVYQKNPIQINIRKNYYYFIIIIILPVTRTLRTKKIIFV